LRLVRCEEEAVVLEAAHDGLEEAEDGRPECLVADDRDRGDEREDDGVLRRCLRVLCGCAA
jgi:hypothetical protein